MGMASRVGPFARKLYESAAGGRATMLLATRRLGRLDYINIKRSARGTERATRGCNECIT
ncbi:hypothetical protein GCM10023078_33400 [Gibbsiella greigii]